MYLLLEKGQFHQEGEVRVLQGEDLGQEVGHLLGEEVAHQNEEGQDQGVNHQSEGGLHLQEGEGDQYPLEDEVLAPGEDLSHLGEGHLHQEENLLCDMEADQGQGNVLWVS